MTDPTTWEVAIESKEWVGPITVTAKVDGTTVPVDAAELKFAVLPEGTRPGDGDWLPPVVEPGGTALGVQADPVDSYQANGIWVQITDSPNVPVLKPEQVGRLIRN